PSRTRVPTLLARPPVRAALGVVTALVLVGGGLAVWKMARGPKVSPPPVTAESGPVSPQSTQESSPKPAGTAVVAAAEAPSPQGAAGTTSPDAKTGTGDAAADGEDALVTPLNPGRDRPRKENRRRSPAPVAAPAPSTAAK